MKSQKYFDVAISLDFTSTTLKISLQKSFQKVASDSPQRNTSRVISGFKSVLSTNSREIPCTKLFISSVFVV